MRGLRKLQWAGVLLLMTVQQEACSSTEARFDKPITEERVVIRVMGTKENADQEVSGELEKRGSKIEDKAEMESGKEPKGSR